MLNYLSLGREGEGRCYKWQMIGGSVVPGHLTDHTLTPTDHNKLLVTLDITDWQPDHLAIQ